MPKAKVISVVRPIDLCREDGTAHGKLAGRRLDHDAWSVLRQFSADESERALGEARYQRAPAARWIVNEFIDDEARAWADGEGRAVDEKDLNLARGVGGDALVIDHGFADIEGRGLAARRLARCLRPHRGRHADFFRRLRGWEDRGGEGGRLGGERELLEIEADLSGDRRRHGRVGKGLHEIGAGHVVRAEAV